MHVNDKMVIGNSHQGFIKDLIAFCDKMSGFVDEERAVDSIYFVFSKAFIAVSYNILVILVRMLCS